MTKEQIERARTVALAMNTRVGGGEWDGEKRYFNDGEVITFTGCSRTMSNAKFEINNDPNWYVWFSQLNMRFLDENLTTNGHNGVIRLLDGTVKDIPEIGPDEFYELVKGKKFRVEVDTAVFGAFNVKSAVWDELPDKYYSTAYKYVVECVENEEYFKLRDLIKGANTKCYDFIEVN